MNTHRRLAAPPTPPPADSDLTSVPKVLTRSVVARMLSCTLSGVRYYERKGALNPTVDRHGVRRFERAEVEALGRELHRTGHRTRMGTRGDIAAAVFRMFRDGQSFAEIVIKTEETPETIRALFEQYKRPLEEPRLPPKASNDDLSDYMKRAREIEDEILARRRRMRGKE
jgi:DNA-binding transcriptional MerR regulator